MLIYKLQLPSDYVIPLLFPLSSEQRGQKSILAQIPHHWLV